MVVGMAVVKMFSAVAAGIMAYGAVREARRRLAFPAGSIVLSVVAVVALVITYYLLFWFVSLTVGRVLAPWNQWAAYAPPHGTWQRQVNDFFQPRCPSVHGCRGGSWGERGGLRYGSPEEWFQAP